MYSLVRVCDKGVVVYGVVVVENNMVDIGVEFVEVGISGDGGSVIREIGCEFFCVECDG